MSVKRKTAWCSGIGLLLLMVGGAVHAEGHLKITLSQPVDKARAEAGVVHFEMENTGDEPVYVFRWKTPFEVNDDRLANPQFDIYDSHGKELRYIGRNLVPGSRRITPESFIVLMPHQSMGKDVDLASDYGMGASGEYSISYKIDLRIRPQDDGANGVRADSVPANTQAEVASNTLKIWISPSLLSDRKGFGMRSVK